MVNMLILCATLIIIFFMYLWFEQNNPYVDTIDNKGTILDNQDKKIGTFIRYKRTYKNGKVIYFEQNYTS